MHFNLQTAETDRVSRSVVPPPIFETPGAESCEAEKIFVALAQAIEQRDLHTASHCERVALILETAVRQ